MSRLVSPDVMFAVDDVQAELRASVRSYVSKHADLGRTRVVAEGDSEFDPAVWNRLASGIGIAALPVPAEDGGAGAGPMEMSVVFQELGRELVPSPLLGSAVLCTEALARSASPIRSEFLSALAAGELIGSAAFGECDAARSATATTSAPTLARAAGGDRWEITGDQPRMLNPGTADIILVDARTPDGIGLFLVEAGSPGVSVRTQRNPDRTRPLGHLTLDSAPCRRLEGDAGRIVEETLLRASLALASEHVGAIGRCLAMTSDYARIRVAFGNPIGAYQGVKHPLAELQVRLALGQALLHEALEHAAAPASLASRAGVHAVAAYLAAAFCDAAYQMMQLHGGIGYTWEHPGHLFYKRAYFSGQLFGTVAEHRAKLAELLLG